MAAPRTSLDLAQSVRAFQALSDPTRLQLVELLRGGERCVCELTDALGSAQNRLSFHLRILKEAGLVQGRREGRWVYYRLNPDQVQELAGFLGECCGPGRTWIKGGCC